MILHSRNRRADGAAKALALAVTAVILAAVIGFLWMRREGGGRSPAAALVDVSALQARADAGNADAQNALGDAHANGRGVAFDYKLAAQWYRAAADQGHPAAQNSLGGLYDAGQGVPHDEAEALKWYRKSAEQGFVGAQYNLGMMYGSGRVVQQDSAEAAKWYERAAEQGDALAQFNVGQRYELGRGVKVDRIEAYKWLELSARQGIDDASQLLKEITGRMSPDQVSEAKRRVTAFKPNPTPATLANPQPQ